MAFKRLLPIVAVLVMLPSLAHAAEPLTQGLYDQGWRQPWQTEIYGVAISSLPPVGATSNVPQHVCYRKVMGPTAIYYRCSFYYWGYYDAYKPTGTKWQLTHNELRALVANGTLSQTIMSEFDLDGDGVSDYWELAQEDGDYTDPAIKPAAPDPLNIDQRFCDDDGNGVMNINEPTHELYDPKHPFSDENGDGKINCWDKDWGGYADSDGDEKVNVYDEDSEYYNPEYIDPYGDSDGDGTKNLYDPQHPISDPDDPLYDSDNDGTPDINDPQAGAKYNKLHENSDHDDDGKPNWADPKSALYNPKKADQNGDGIPDLYDPTSRYYDSDGDGIADINCPLSDSYDRYDPHSYSVDGGHNIKNTDWATQHGDDYEGGDSWVKAVEDSKKVPESEDPSSANYDENDDGIPDIYQKDQLKPYNPSKANTKDIQISDSLSFTDKLIKALGLNLSKIKNYSASEYTASVEIPIGGTLDNLTYHTVPFSLNPDDMDSSQSAAKSFLTTIRDIIGIFMKLAVSWLFFKNIYQLLWNL